MVAIRARVRMARTDIPVRLRRLPTLLPQGAFRRRGRPGALGSAAIAGRFAENDLIRILTCQAGLETVEPTRPSEDHSLQPGTSAWSSFGLADDNDEH